MASPMTKNVCLRCMKSVSSCRPNKVLSSWRRFYCEDSIEPKKKAKFATGPTQLMSGIQPTGIPHIGNYLGAIRNWVKLQHKYPGMILSIVDLHAITIPQNPEILRNNIYDMTACLLACGIDPKMSILFKQSTVSHHAELSWILSCVCSMNRLQNFVQWKEKGETTADPSVGLFTYPIMQSADILLYRSTDIPAGDDQTQHIELARDLARTFNRTFGVLFPKPTALPGELPKVRSLRNPDKKMSKSEVNPLGKVEITDSPEEITKKLKKAVSDSTSKITYEPETRPGVSNLIDIHSAFTGLFPEEICEQSLLMDTLQYKLSLANVISEKLQPIREEIKKLQNDRPYLDSVLKEGHQKASSIAEVTFRRVKQLVGFS